MKDFILTKLLDKNGNPSKRKKDWLLNPSNHLDIEIQALTSLLGVDVKTVEPNKFNEALYCYINNTSSPDCVVCSAPTPFQNFKKGYSKCCSAACSAKLGGSAAKEAYSNMDSVRKEQVFKKREDTFEQKYGIRARSPLQIGNAGKQASVKAMGTKYDRYGEKFRSEETRLKVESTLMERYGVTNQAFVSLNRTSKLEEEVCQFLASLGVHYTTSVRDKGKFEIDILCGNVGIECHGEYWHSIDVNPKGNIMYHHEKYIEAKKNGINLIQLFGTEILTEATKNMIKSKLGLLERVYARQCTVSVEPTSDELKSFLNKYHPRGSTKATFYIVLRKDGEIVSAMTALQNGNETNITRFCSSKTVVGGFTKCLSALKQVYDKTTTIVSFLDLRYSNEDNVYSKNGFVVVKRLTPDYFYFYKGELKHKFLFRKDKMLKMGASGKVESEMAKSINALRVYDAGKIKYELRLQ